jgi:UDPglucose--hexose-1-phosphate uridylyltransferase
MAAGMFELRKDDVTGWWVAVVVDRRFDRERFARTAARVRDRGQCHNCDAPGEGVRVRELKRNAFHVLGTEREARELEREIAQVSLGTVGESGSWETVIAPPLHHLPLAEEEPGIVVAMLARVRERLAAAQRAAATEYVQVVHNWGAQAGALTNHLCFDLYDLPQIPHRVGEEMGGAARYVIREGECPYCAMVRDEVRGGERLLFEDAASVAFAPYASRSPFEIWVVPRAHAADFGAAGDDDLTSCAEMLQKALRLLGLLDAPPYNLVLHTAPLRERVDATYHWHWEIHPRLREIAGLELGTGLPVNPIAPEEAVAELLEASRAPARRHLQETPT